MVTKMTQTEDTSKKNEVKESATQVGESRSSSKLLDLRTTTGQILFVVLTIVTSLAFQYLMKLYAAKDIPSNIPDNKTQQLTPDLDTHRPIYAIYGKGNSKTYLKHVHAVLYRLGFKEGTVENDWDLLWAHDYPFRIFGNKLKTLMYHQRVNHFPGTGFITNKVDLATSNLPYIPPAFRIPKDEKKFLEYIKENPKKRFVQKHNQHRNIEIKDIEEIDFSSNDTFIQEYIDNPYLVDGYKFDIGVYVTITSVNPLRIYIHDREVLFRYCPVKYYPFDSKVVDKYIVGDDYLPTWDVPSLSKLYLHQKLGMKDSFDTYVENNGGDPKIIWEQVEDAVRTAILAKEKNIVEILKNYKCKRNFFEMMRFDLIIDENLKVYLMEANMSPNLSSAHFKPNQLLYEQVIYDLLNLIGVGSPIDRASLRALSTEAELMISADKNIAIHGATCSREPCTSTCAPSICRYCWPCLTRDDISILHQAYREHIQKGGNKRIFPKPIVNITNYNIEKEIENLSEQNAFITKWFHGKCEKQSSWCL